MKILVIVDMQNDFISGSLGTKEALEIVPSIVQRIKEFDGDVFYTRDTHGADYLTTQEGRNLPVEHCIQNTWGWQIHSDIEKLKIGKPINKAAFGSIGLGEFLTAKNASDNSIESIMLMGVCTDICIISNALLLKAFMPEIPILVDASCCAGVTPESHRQALEAMKVCHIDIINE